MGAKTNRLASELSPYLQQHAGNPVDWYPWGEEALEKAKREDKPILLSIGYSACHWCHVMERESFEDEETARAMNASFVSIKVDREERPDLDQVYQAVVQIMGRSGGWPLTVFLTPDRAPFFAGTYFPPEAKYGMPSFKSVLEAVSRAYTTQRDDVLESARDVTTAVREVITADAAQSADPPRDLLQTTATKLLRRADVIHGGFGSAPKFPSTMSVDLLLRAHARHADEACLVHVRRTLDAMRDGGVYDQLGGGFHRYSTDAYWLVPHFEKMLYDNALLVRLYADMVRVMHDPRDARTIRDTCAYLVREMRAPEGGFYATQDADSEGEEGRFFVFRPEDLSEALDPELAELAALAWGVDPEGNFEGTGATVLHVRRPIAEVASEMGLAEDVAAQKLEEARAALLAARQRRVKPFRDEKILAAWNGLAISAFVDAAGALGEPSYLAIARGALSFVRDRMWKDGVLHRLALGTRVTGEGFAEDYGLVACAALDVYEASGDEEARAFARALVTTALDRFFDPATSLFFFAASDRDLVVRSLDLHDDATPSGAAALLHAMLRLATIDEDAALEEKATRVVRAMTPHALNAPSAMGHAIAAMERYLFGATEIVIVAKPGDPEGDAMVAVALASAARCRTVRRVEDGATPAVLGGRRAESGKATAYVCEERACGLPLHSADALREALEA